MQARGALEPLIPVVRRIAADVDPALRLHEGQSLADATSEDARFWTVFARVVLGGSALTLVLSLAGIYAGMSFTVSRRTRDIGMRTALGGTALRVIGEVFRRPFRQVVAGVAVGWLVWAGVITLAAGDSPAGLLRHAPLLLAHGAAILVICGLACLGPILRALRVQPIQALREDG